MKNELTIQLSLGSWANLLGLCSYGFRGHSRRLKNKYSMILSSHQFKMSFRPWAWTMWIFVSIIRGFFTRAGNLRIANSFPAPCSAKTGWTSANLRRIFCAGYYKDRRASPCSRLAVRIFLSLTRISSVSAGWTMQWGADLLRISWVEVPSVQFWWMYGER